MKEKILYEESSLPSWQRWYRHGSLVEQLLQLDSAIVTVCAARFARLRTNRANYASQVKHMLYLLLMDNIMMLSWKDINYLLVII